MEEILYWKQSRFKVNEKNFEEEFSSVIKTHLNTDVPNATALSGGVDSSLITFKAASIYKECASFTKIAEGIDSVAEKFLKDSKIGMKFKINTVKIGKKNYVKDICEFIEYSGCPPRWGTPPSIMPLYREMSKQGYKVCLGGDGADEIFYGYQNYQKLVDNAKE